MVKNNHYFCPIIKSKSPTPVPGKKIEKDNYLTFLTKKSFWD
jgi:hypothetical protein